ncbi:helix-turn-helix domain-containing protein [Bacillus sp. FJAT-29790]|uniref:helix-turn-helix domain-containing protein n=1 Tax=Bacillus sp. FJAT-29790 TaxID=1895002 RepID=UPI001C248EFF|nr:helix-turn-helix transcriptional regulator [Bacillus sp. FJAT-29790]MBU8881094.1 helix-turn-helix domain-containing protein [Bacillus sp. FJAT-29790]
MTLSEILKKLRNDRNWSQDFVANLMNLSRSTISKYETGEIIPPYQTLLQLANIYKVDKTLLIEELNGESSGDVRAYILKENPDDHDFELIMQLLRESPELKMALLDMYNFDVKRKAVATKAIQMQIQLIKREW